MEHGLYKFLSPVVVDGRAVSELQTELVAQAQASAQALVPSGSANGVQNNSSSSSSNSSNSSSSSSSSSVDIGIDGDGGSLTATRDDSGGGCGISGGLIGGANVAGCETNLHGGCKDGTRVDTESRSGSEKGGWGRVGKGGVEPISQLPGHFSPRNGVACTDVPPNLAPPMWYSEGGAVTALLAQAETIDWSQDTGGEALPITGKIPKGKGGRSVKAAAAKVAKDAARLVGGKDDEQYTAPVRQKGKRGSARQDGSKSKRRSSPSETEENLGIALSNSSLVRTLTTPDIMGFLLS